MKNVSNLTLFSSQAKGERKIETNQADSSMQVNV